MNVNTFLVRLIIFRISVFIILTVFKVISTTVIF